MSLANARLTFRKVHHLKCHPEHFKETWMGRKPFEVRLNDRDYQVGDLLHLREWVPGEERFTPREVAGPITYLTDFGCQPGYVVLGNPEASQVWWASELEAERDPRHTFIGHEPGDDCDSSCGNQVLCPKRASASKAKTEES